MKQSDLSPKSVDNHPIRKRGHIFDCINKTTFIGIKAKDSYGKEWRVLEDTEGVYKLNQR